MLSEKSDTSSPKAHCSPDIENLMTVFIDWCKYFEKIENKRRRKGQCRFDDKL